MYSFRFVLIFVLLLISHLFVIGQDMDKELSALAANLASQIKDGGKKKVTVLDFTDLQGGANELGKYVAEELTVDLVMAKKDFSVVDRANLRKILAEHKLTASGLVDPENAKKLGMFAGVDAFVVGLVIPKGQQIDLIAKIIATDTTILVGASKTSFKSDETALRLLQQPTVDTAVVDEPRPPIAAKPFGDLEVKVESLKYKPLEYSFDRYGVASLTLIITNKSTTVTYGVAIQSDLYNTFNLSNSRGDEFKASEVTGIERAYESGFGNGTFGGSFTDILPRTSITIVAKSQVLWDGKPGDYRPYRLQTIVFFGIENQGRYKDVKKHNLVLDIR